MYGIDAKGLQRLSCGWLSPFEDVSEDKFVFRQCHSKVFACDEQMWNVFEGIWVYIIHVDCVEGRKKGCAKDIISPMGCKSPVRNCGGCGGGAIIAPICCVVSIT